MINTIELRNKPELKIILNNEEFEIIDASEPKNSGTYSFKKLINIELKEEKTNWFVSTLSIIVDFFTGVAVGGKLKDKANLNFEMENQNLIIWLIDVDFEKTKRVTQLLKDANSQI